MSDTLDLIPAPSAEAQIGEAPVSTGDQVRAGAMWSAARSILLRTAGMLVMILVVRIVSPEEFGVWAVALTAHTIIINSAELGVGALLMRRDTDLDELAPTAAFIALASSGALALTMFLGAEPLATALGSSDAAPALRVLSLSVVLIGLLAVPNAQLARDFRQRGLFFANVFSVVIGNAVLLGLASTGAGPMAFAWSLVAGQVAAGIVIVKLTGRWYWPQMQRSASGALLRFGAPLAAANMVNYAFLNLDYVVIGRVRGAAVLGTYLLAFNVSSWPYAILGSSINSVSMPAFSDASRAGGLQRRLEITLQAVSLVAFPITAMLTVLSGPLVATLYGSKWDDAAPALAMLAPYGAMFLLTLVIGNALVGLGRSKTILVLQVMWLATLLPLMLVLVRTHGARGAAAAHLVSIAVVMGPIYLVLAKRLLGVDLRGVLSSIAGPLSFSVVAAAVALLASSASSTPIVQLALGGTAGSTVYLLLASPLLLTRLGRRLPLVPSLLGPVARSLGDTARRRGLGLLYSTSSERSPSLGALPPLETVR